MVPGDHLCTELRSESSGTCTEYQTTEQQIKFWKQPVYGLSMAYIKFVLMVSMHTHVYMCVCVSMCNQTL